MQELNRQMMALPELRELEEIIRFGTGPAAVSGVSGVHRAMLGAALRQETKRPLAVLCADEQEARRMAADLAALTGEECVTLFAREWQLRDRVSASHSFEQERLDALCRMAFGRTGIVVATVDGMMQRTLPPTALRDAVLTLRLGEEHDLRALAERLTAAGYVRCEQVEGAGQFAVRGGILDVYSPMSAPVRVEFFDTEIDAMGEFDVATQRRTKNLEELTVLPAAEVLPFAAEGGRDAMLARMEHAAAQLAKKETTEKTAAAIRADMDRLREGLPLGGMDRYLAAAYPTAVCAADYLPEGSIVLVCEGSRVMERAKGCAFEWGEDLKILLEEGVLAGQFASLAVELEDLTRRLRGSFPLLLCDSLPTSRYLAPPRAMLSINARQLPSYGGSLETAAADMEHYLAAGSGVLVLCGNETRARNFHRLLEERGVRARLDLSDQTLPAERGLRIPAAPPCHSDRGAASCAGQRQSAARGAAEKGFEPSEAPLLHRPDAGRPRRSPAPRHRPLCRHGAHPRGRRGQGLYQDRLRRQRQPVRSRDAARYGVEVHRQPRRRGGGRARQAEQARRHGLDEGQIPRQGRGEGSCQGAYQALRRTAAPPRLRLFAGLHLAARV